MPRYRLSDLGARVIRELAGTNEAAVADPELDAAVANPGAPMLVSDGGSETPTVPITTFVGPTDPTTVPALAALVIPGAVWVDTRYGPPYAQKQWETDNGWEPSAFVAYDADGNLTARVNADPTGVALILAQSMTADEVASVRATLDDTRMVCDGLDARSLVVGRLGFVLTGLPTSDPAVAGALWSNSGVVTVSAGPS